MHEIGSTHARHKQGKGKGKGRADHTIPYSSPCPALPLPYPCLCPARALPISCIINSVRLLYLIPVWPLEPIALLTAGG